jgi:hypothetical protein
MSAPIIIEIRNPSPSAALRLSYQERAKPEDTADDQPAPVSARNFSGAINENTRERYGDFGSELVPFPIRGTNRVSQVPRWQAEDASSLQHWIAQRISRRDSVASTPAAPKGTRFVDAWQDPRSADGIAAHGSTRVQLTDGKRVVIECSEETVLSISNPSGTNSLRLRQLDKKTGKTSNVAILQPFKDFQQSGTLTLSPKNAGVIEALPS